MGIFGSGFPIMEVSQSGEKINLDTSTFDDYSFFNPDVVEHVSVFTGFRTYVYSRNQSTFKIDINLVNYSASQADEKFNKLYQNINEPWIFYPHNDNPTASVDVFKEPIQYFITDFTPYYLDNDSKFDGLIIELSPRKNSVLFSTDINLGYGFNYGLNYGIGL